MQPIKQLHCPPVDKQRTASPILRTGPLSRCVHWRPAARPIHNSALQLPLVSITSLTLWLWLKPPLVTLAQRSPSNHRAQSLTQTSERDGPVSTAAAGWEEGWPQKAGLTVSWSGAELIS